VTQLLAVLSPGHSDLKKKGRCFQ